MRIIIYKTPRHLSFNNFTALTEIKLDLIDSFSIARKLADRNAFKLDNSAIFICGMHTILRMVEVVSPHLIECSFRRSIKLFFVMSTELFSYKAWCLVTYKSEFVCP